MNRFNGLDQDGVEDVHQLLQKLKKEGKCILLASHSATDISKACDEVYKIKEGKIYRRELKRRTQLRALDKVTFRDKRKRKAQRIPEVSKGAAAPWAH